MRIILLSQHFPPEVGAPQIRLYEVSKELLKRGHEVEVITAFPHHPHGIIPDEYKGKFYQYEEYEGIPVHRSWIYPSPKGTFWRRLMSYFSFTFSAFYSMIKAKKTDVIICTSPPLFLGITGYISSKLKRAKFVFNVADIWPESAVELGILKNKKFISLAEKLEEFLYKKAWKIATATEGIADYMLKKGKKKEKVFLLPNGVNTETFQPGVKNEEWLRKLGFEGKKVFTFAGRMGYAQGLDSVIRAAKIVEETNPEIRFLFIGDGPEKEELVELKNSIQADNVIFHDSVPVTMMPDVFSISDFSIVSLRNIALFQGARPSKIFPALASGVPVLYCGVGESAKLIEDSGSGIIAAPEDDQDIAIKIIQCANLTNLEYEKYSLSGREFVCREFSWGRIVDDLLENIQDYKKR
ncbi:glycosyltransferase family 4 protein [Fictibacillus barbaricus]|uniref:Glycosyltransferase involved in cell wall biosynthesis n=1 Tax=Fictibacillus barbaricus TaxID=182136 RepID=A0ABU1U127_9BACL|nr:glycosyltransferase family 4 protein [Fictibacillus barbaricus]MDR7073174.1 glycosyltransferase involved in cell wall biosynthesis [Fictibacillus barbaricus]